MWKKLFNSSKSDDKTESNFVDQLDPEKLPRHVAIIMDGNGRWAKGQGLLRSAGHVAGVKSLKAVLKFAIKLHIEAITVYAFSTENWKRPAIEVEFLMKLFSDSIQNEINEMDEDNMQIRFIGRINELPTNLQVLAKNAEERTKSNTGLKFNIAVNYGGQDELVRAFQSIASDVARGRIEPKAINETLLEQHLDTAMLPPVDLVIRTSGDMRLSNFLLWQTAYAELWFTETNWPDFTPECFAEALYDFGQRERRFGGVKA